MPIINLTPDAGGQPDELCAGRYYLFEESDLAVTYLWNVGSTPPSVTAADVVFTSPQGKRTLVQVPVTGEYCFYTTKGVEA